MNPSVTVEIGDRVATVTIDRQHARNAYDPATLRTLADLLGGFRSQGIRAAVLTGAGETSFSSGMDLRSLGSLSRDEVSEAVSRFNNLISDPARVTLIAAVNGEAAGGGFEVALRCDLVVAASHATFRLPEVQRGIVPGGGATLLSARIPIAIANELALVGEPITAMRAHELGLVNAVVEPEALLSTALAYARRIARNGPRAVARTRALLWQTLMETASMTWADTRRNYDDQTLREEMDEGVAAFLEKREPRWD